MNLRNCRDHDDETRLPISQRNSRKFECVVSFANLFSALKITKACFLSTNILFLQRVVGGTGFDEVL